jgi:hypothetical protein
VGAALTTTERVGTARRLGSAKRDGTVYECRNQWWNPLKSVRQLQPGRCGLDSGARPPARHMEVDFWDGWEPSPRRPR